MARHPFGGSLAAYVITAGEAQASGFTNILVPNATVTFWNRRSGGTRYTDLLDSLGDEVDSVTSDSEGGLPEFEGPDGINIMYADAGGQRRLIFANDLGGRVDNAQATANAAQETAEEALAAAGGGGGAVSSVNGQQGNVVLAPADIGAVSAAPGNVVPLGIDDQWLRIDIADEDNLTSPDRFEYRFQGQRTSWHNEYGEPRSQAARDTTVPLKSRAHSSSQSANLYQAEDHNGVALGGWRADGRAFAPNVGSSPISASSSPPSGSTFFGDLWVDMALNPPVLKVWNGSQWVPVDSGGEPAPPPEAAPAFMGSESGRLTFEQVSATKPSGDTLVAFVSWNTDDEIVAPDGWSEVQTLQTGSFGSGVWVASSTVTDLTWATMSGNTAKWAWIVLGYEPSSVSSSAPFEDTDADTTYEGPALSVPTAPVTVVRFWGLETSTVPEFTAPAEVTERAAMETDGGGGAAYAFAGDAEQADTGVAPSADATSTVSSQSVGYAIALVLA